MLNFVSGENIEFAQNFLIRCVNATRENTDSSLFLRSVGLRRTSMHADATQRMALRRIVSWP